MPRRPRAGTGGFVFHVMNRGARRMPLFDSDQDYALFLRVLRAAQERVPLRLLSYVLMPNHWHLVVWPAEDDELSQFMGWMTVTHSRCWHRRRRSTGTGTIYQGRFKAIPVKDDHHFLVVCRYVERNPVKARLTARSAAWRWSSASTDRLPWAPRLAPWPVDRPEPWDAYVDRDEGPGEFDRLRASIRSGAPFGPEAWRDATSRRLTWTAGRRSPGRPPAAKDRKN